MSRDVGPGLCYFRFRQLERITPTGLERLRKLLHHGDLALHSHERHRQRLDLDRLVRLNPEVFQLLIGQILKGTFLPRVVDVNLVEEHVGKLALPAVHRAQGPRMHRILLIVRDRDLRDEIRLRVILNDLRQDANRLQAGLSLFEKRIVRVLIEKAGGARDRLGAVQQPRCVQYQ